MAEQKINFVAVKHKYDNLTPGEKADIARVKTPEDIGGYIAFHKMVPAGESTKQWERIVFMLPWFGLAKTSVKHSVKTEPEGDVPGKTENNVVAPERPESSSRGIAEIMALSGVREMAVRQMIRSRYPRDIEHLRRIACQCASKGYGSIDWNKFGETLYFWGKNQKQRIIEEYCHCMVQLGKVKSKSQGNAK